ncbi:MAG: hypothetical protein J0H54_05595 [Rhizobiales bacterium]|nr:hypothetical protein [Hyphomicrobiales bacterium]
MRTYQTDPGVVILLADGKVWADALFPTREAADSTARNLQIGPHEIRGARRLTGWTRGRTAGGAPIVGMGRGKSVRELVVDDE